MPHKEACKECGKLVAVDGASRHHLCSTCEHTRRYPPPPPAPSPSPSPSPPPSPSHYGRMPGCIDQLSEMERSAVVALHNVGFTNRHIAQVIKCSEHAVGRWVDRWNKERSVSDVERGGRPRCTSEERDEDIYEYADEKVNVVPKDIVHGLELDVSARTVRRRLNESGLFGCVQHEEHAYTAEHLRRRLSFAEGYGGWSEDDWSRVIFSDETHFYLGHCGREYVQRPLGMREDPKYTRKMEQMSGMVSLWGCMCAEGLGHAELYDYSMKAVKYQSMLYHNLKPTARQLYPVGQWWFQQDNWSVHTAGTTRRWFDEKGIDVIDWPAWSPDLNPIENLWSDLKARVYAHHATTLGELEGWIRHEWAATDIDLVMTLCRSMPNRIKQLVDNQGHKVSY